MDPITGAWREVGDHLAREKVGQTLRDSLHNKYSSSTKAKKRRRQAEKAKARTMSIDSQTTEELPMPKSLSAFTAVQGGFQPAFSSETLRSRSPVQADPLRPQVPDQQQSSGHLRKMDSLSGLLKMDSSFGLRNVDSVSGLRKMDSSSGLRKMDSSALFDIFFDEKHYETLKDLNDGELCPRLANMLSEPVSPNIVRGKAA